MTYVFQSIDELEASVGNHLGYSDWYTITQEQVNQFADATEDHQWIHIDPERAKGGPFGAPIAHGFLTLSLIPKLAWQIYDISGLSMSVNYGFNKVRFLAPVPVESRIRAGVELMDVSRSSAGAQAITKTTLELEGSDKPACVAENIALYVE
jgi:acyl dehydratase